MYLVSTSPLKTNPTPFQLVKIRLFILLNTPFSVAQRFELSFTRLCLLQEQWDQPPFFANNLPHRNKYSLKRVCIEYSF
jgi:hypothetical protein